MVSAVSAHRGRIISTIFSGPVTSDTEKEEKKESNLIYVRLVVGWALLGPARLAAWLAA